MYSICDPVLGGAFYVKSVEDAHHAHLEHEKHEHGETEKPNYSWLNKRGKPFPWGMNSLFFNPEVSAGLPLLVGITFRAN